MKEAVLSKRFYLPGFILASLLNLLLAIVLIRTVFPQTAEKRLIYQPPVVIEAAQNAQDPLFLAIIDVNNSNTPYQVVNYSVQNISNKPIRAYVINGGLENGGKITTNFFPVNLFQAGAIFKEEFILERANIKAGLSLSLSVDYVEFADGTAWGKDTQKRSEYIAGQRSGTLFVAAQLEDLVGKGEVGAVMTILNNPLEPIDLSLPETSKNKSEKWHDGFRFGYKSTMNLLKSQSQKGEDIFFEKLVEIRKNLHY